MSPEVKELSIVLIGKLNPVIANPFWLAHKEFLSELEAQQAATGPNYINTHEVTQFALSFCNLQFLLEQFSASTSQEGHFTHVKELVSNIFGSLQETPILAMGINFNFHFRSRDLSTYNAWGDKLAPKIGLWKNIHPQAGLKSIQIQTPRTDDFVGNINITAGVSTRIPISQFGLQISINNHFDFAASETKVLGANNALKALNDTWDKAMQSAESVAAQVVQW